MLQHLLTEGMTPTFASGLGSVLTGISELLLALGAGIGFLVRYRNNSRREHERIRTAAANATREAADKLDKQYADRVAQYEETIDRMQQAYDNQQRMYEEKLTNLQNLNTRLVNQILKSNDDRRTS